VTVRRGLRYRRRARRLAARAGGYATAAAPLRRVRCAARCASRTPYAECAMRAACAAAPRAVPRVCRAMPHEEARAAMRRGRNARRCVRVHASAAQRRTQVCSVTSRNAAAQTRCCAQREAMLIPLHAVQSPHNQQQRLNQRQFARRSESSNRSTVIRINCGGGCGRQAAAGARRRSGAMG